MKSHTTHDTVVVAICDSPLTEEHHKAIQFHEQNPNVKIEIVSVFLDKDDDLITFLDKRADNEYVYVQNAPGCAASILRAAIAGLSFGFFERGVAGVLKLYAVKYYCLLELVYKGQSKALAATPGSEYHLP